VGPLALATLLVAAALAGATSPDVARPGAGSRPSSVSVTASLGLPLLPVPADSPLTPARVALGRKLFMDRRLSRNGTMSCGMCHVPEQGFTSNEMATSIGLEGRSVRRNAPTLLNVGYLQPLFHDGRETSLETQVWSPLLAASEMGNPSVGAVVELVRGLADYRGLFERAFGGRRAGVETIGQALASYQRTLVSAGSRFDRWHYGGDAGALDPIERAGFDLFAGKGACIQCHPVTRRFALFTDQRFHNTGVGWARSMVRAATHRVQLAPGVFAEIPASVVATIGEPPPADVGRFEITQDPADRWAYRTPTLRNVALTAPYMHDGSLPTLEAVVAFYDRGGVDNPGKDPRIRPLGLDGDERRALAAFLRALTGENVEALAASARAGFPAPTGGAGRR
jgi:cytochrome c peroxidase